MFTRFFNSIFIKKPVQLKLNRLFINLQFVYEFERRYHNQIYINTVSMVSITK